uniref:RRM domain-containing protein n=1 Tax=Globodera rostochiensis TaxID=31243 RepID=A0A914I8P6_GLORO
MPGICGGIVRKFNTSKNGAKRQRTDGTEKTFSDESESSDIDHNDLDMMDELSERDMDSSEDENTEDFDEDALNEEVEEEEGGQKKEKVSRRKRLKESLANRRATESRTVFVGNAPSTSTRRDIRKLFRSFGTIEAVYQRTLLQMTEKLTKLMQGKDKTLKDRLKSTNFFVRFSSQEEAESAAKQMNGTNLDGHTIRAILSNRHKFGQSFSIFLGNLPYAASDEQIRTHFAPCGPIVAVRVLHNKCNGMGTGAAYVQFEQRESCAKALEMNGQTLGGRPLRVSKVAKKNKLSAKAKGSSFSSNGRENRRDNFKNGGEVPEGSEKFIVLKRKQRRPPGTTDGRAGGRADPQIVGQRPVDQPPEDVSHSSYQPPAC